MNDVDSDMATISVIMTSLKYKILLTWLYKNDPYWSPKIPPHLWVTTCLDIDFFEWTEEEQDDLFSPYHLPSNKLPTWPPQPKNKKKQAIPSFLLSVE